MGRCCCLPRSSCCRKDRLLLDDTQDSPVVVDARGCTDMACLLLFALTMGVFAAVGGAAFAMGDPAALQHGTDHLGRRCGSEGELADYPAVFYPRLSHDLVEQRDVLTRTPWALHLYGVCVAACPQHGDPPVPEPGTSRTWPVGTNTANVANRCLPIEESSTANVHACVEPACGEAGEACLPVGERGVQRDGMWLLETDEQRGRCVRAAEISSAVTYGAPNADGVLRSLAAATGTMSRAWASTIASAGEVVLCGVVLAVVVSAAWLLFLRLCARFTVWLLLGTTTLILLVATALCAAKASLFDGAALAAHARDALATHGVGGGDELHASVSNLLAADAENATAFTWAAGALALVSLLYICLLCMLRSAVRTMVTIVEQATLVVGAHPAMLFVPLGSLAATLALSLYAAVALAFLVASEPTADTLIQLQAAAQADAEANAEAQLARIGVDADVPSTALLVNVTAAVLSPLEPSALKTALIAFHIFGFLWAFQLVNAVGWTGMSGAASHWFFFRQHAAQKMRFPVFCSLWRVVRYHLGSVAFGALLVAAVQSVRLLFEWLERQSRAAGEGSDLGRFVVRCTRCCLWCLEKCVRFVSSYCFIFTALNGDSFCAACRQTVRLATAYPAQLATNALVQSLLYAVQSLLVPLLCALAAFRLVQADALPGWIEALERAINGAGDSYNGALQRGPDWLEHVPLVPSVTLAWALGPAVDEPVEPVWPALAAFILAYTVSRAFAAVYECAVDTLFVCAVVDKDEYGGVHMSAALRDALELDDDVSRRKSKSVGGRAETRMI